MDHARSTCTKPAFISKTFETKLDCSVPCPELACSQSHCVNPARLVGKGGSLCLTAIRHILKMMSYFLCALKSIKISRECIWPQLRYADIFSWLTSSYLLFIKNKICFYLCPHGLSSVSATSSQQSVQQFSLMLTCFSKARRLCLKKEM